MKDYLIRGIDETGKIRVFIASTTNLVEKARRSHETSATATAALGRALTATALMSAMSKNTSDSMSLKIQGGGPLGRIITTGNTRGEVKGYVDYPMADLETRAGDGKLDVGGLVGKDGYITITRDLGLKEPYVGTSKLISGEIAEDIAAYYAISEQQPSAVALGVLVDKDLSVKASGGFIIQLLPGVSEEEILLIEESLSKIKPISYYIDLGMSPEEIMDKLLPGFKMKVLARQRVFWSCDCSKDRVTIALESLSKEDLEEILSEDKGAELVCHFCNKKYPISEEELEKIIVDKI